MVINPIVYIIGFMGSGKTTTGRKIASMLNWTFIDLDRKIEEYTGKSIPSIFSELGEEYFREIESEVLRNLGNLSGTVIATGGGTPCHRDNMDFMLENGLTVYLKLTPEQLKSRLSKSSGQRPLIKDISDSDLLDFIKNKLTAREIYYNRAKIHFDGFNTDYILLQSALKKILSSEH